MGKTHRRDLEKREKGKPLTKEVLSDDHNNTVLEVLDYLDARKDR